MRGIPRKGKVCTRLILKFDLRHLLPQNQNSPSTAKALPRRCKANDSALIRALIFIDQTLGYKIGNVNYVMYLLLVNNIR